PSCPLSRSLSLHVALPICPAILINEKIGRTLSTGITFGIFMGIAVILSGELPARLRGFWPLWMRLLVGVILGTLAGTLVWIVYAWLLLYLALPTLDYGALAFGGLGVALGFALAGTFRIPAWIALPLSAAILFFCIWFSYTQLAYPFLYFTGPDVVI